MKRAEITQGIQQWLERRAGPLEGVQDPFTRLSLTGFQRMVDRASEVPDLRTEPQTEWDVVVTAHPQHRASLALVIRRYLSEHLPLTQVVGMVSRGPLVLVSGVPLARAEAIRADLLSVQAVQADVQVVPTP